MMTLCHLTRPPTNNVRRLEDAVQDVGKLVPAPVSVQIRLERPDVDGLLDSKHPVIVRSVQNHKVILGSDVMPRSTVEVQVARHL